MVLPGDTSLHVKPHKCRKKRKVNFFEFNAFIEEKGGKLYIKSNKRNLVITTSSNKMLVISKKMDLKIRPFR